jgi:NAD(P)-dependent dehydrogenase (short-subunit alcohol dehydrogenase family)
MWERRDAMCPTGKQGEPWDVAYAALFLASDDSRYVNGTTLIVDGGVSQTMRSFRK